MNHKLIANNIVRDIDQLSLRINIEKLGMLFAVPLNGFLTKAIVLTANGLNNFGVNVEKVFSHKRVVQNGLVVNLSLREQVKLLARIIELQPELRETIGLYNLRGSRVVSQVLRDTNLCNAMNVSWFWTGEKHQQKPEELYPKPDIIFLSKMEKPDGAFYYIDFSNGLKGDDNPGNSHETGVVVFGTK